MMRPASHLQLLIVVASLAAASPARSGARDKEIEALVDLSVAQHSVVASCTVLQNREFDLTMSAWERERSENVMPMLVKLGVAPDVFVRLIQKMAPENLTTMTKGPVGELMEYCAKNRQTLLDMYQLKGVMLPVELEKMLKQ